MTPPCVRQRHRPVRAGFGRPRGPPAGRQGIAIAKAKGGYKGRKKALPLEQLQVLVGLARSGTPKAELARNYGVSRETVYQHLRGGA